VYSLIACPPYPERRPILYLSMGFSEPLHRFRVFANPAS
jgi:hypothetical protein